MIMLINNLKLFDSQKILRCRLYPDCRRPMMPFLDMKIVFHSLLDCAGLRQYPTEINKQRHRLPLLVTHFLNLK